MRYWKRTNSDETTKTVESYSHNLDVDGAIEITKEEYDTFIASLPEPEPTPPLCTHWAIIDSFNIGQERPVLVRRTWEGKEYTVNCYATEAAKDQYQAGDIAIGDYVMVEFLDDDPNRAVAFAKVFKTW